MTNTETEKSDKADALGIAYIMRTGWFRQAYIKSESCYRTKLLLTRRRNLKAKFLDLEGAPKAEPVAAREPAEQHGPNRQDAATRS